MDGLHFDTVFEILAAFEAFTAWRARAFIGTPTPRLGNKPAVDMVKCADVTLDLIKQGNFFKAAFKVIKMGIGHSLKTTWYYTKRWMLVFSVWFCMNFHNFFGVVLKFSPVVALPLYSCAYFFEIKKDWLGIDWSCSPDDNGNFIISGMIASCVFRYITIKAVLYILCAVMNWHMNRVNGVEVSKPNMNDFVH